MSTFDISYRITVLKGEQIDEKIEKICMEQSAELPRSVLSEDIEQRVAGAVSRKEEVEEGIHEVSITWPFENIGNNISQFLNILYGNISLQPGIQVTGCEWGKLDEIFNGPALGIPGFRNRCGIRERALCSTALKPLGLNAEEIGDLCYQFAVGGLDIIKDDHGLANQLYAPFEDRVKACVNGIQKAAEETGRRACYFPHIMAAGSDTLKRYRRAAELGADGVLICPHIVGMETMHQLASLDDISLPVIAHPAFSGGLIADKSRGLSPDFLYGELWRALGADFVVYPNTGGRFSFTPETCQAINECARTDKSPFKPAFPMPGGGMKRSNIPHWLETYGTDTVFLVGTSLYEYPEGPREAAKELSGMLK